MKQTLTWLWLLPALLQWPPAGLAETTVYRSTSESGAVVFSDEPQPGATPIEVEDPPTYSAPALPRRATERADEQAEGAYRALELVQPQPEATVWDNQGNLQVRYAVDPRLRSGRGHRLVVLLDGEPQPPVAASEYQFENLDRGAHEVQARIVDARGGVLIESEPATLYLQRQSVNYPARGRQPRPPGVVPPTRPPSPAPGTSSGSPSARGAAPGS
ncbi:MAG: hypothetical protein PVI91_00515 [Gammaproteobacteria bacterium]